VKILPKFPFKCPCCGYEIKKWADLGCHWSPDLHCKGIKKCPKPPKTKRVLMRKLRKIVVENSG